MTFRSDHHFRLWDYDVSHDKLLLRSAESPSQPYNIDIVFYAVERLDIPTLFMGGLEISEPDPSEGPRDGLNIFRIAADGQQYSIVALAYYVFKNRLDTTDSILDRLDGWGLTEEMGEVLHRPAKPGSLSGAST